MSTHLNLAFHRPWTLRRLLPWMITVVAVFGLGWQMLTYQKWTDERAQLHSKLNRPPILPPPARMVTEQERLQYQRLSQVVEQLNRPAFLLRETLMVASHPDVAILSIEESAQAESFSLTVEAKDNATLQAYWSALNNLPELSRVRLMEKFVRKEGTYQVIRANFMLEQARETAQYLPTASASKTK